MSTTISVEEAQTRLKELIDNLAPGDEVLLTRGEEIVARLTGGRRALAERPPPGLGKGSILYIAPDFDDFIPEEFNEYIE